MTLQSTFDLDIFIKVTTSSSQTVISVRGVEEVFSLIQYSILALIASFLATIGSGLDRMMDQLREFVTWLKVAFLAVGEIDKEFTVWLKVVIYFSFSFGKGLCRELVAIGT